MRYLSSHPMVAQVVKEMEVRRGTNNRGDVPPLPRFLRRQCLKCSDPAEVHKITPLSCGLRQLLFQKSFWDWCKISDGTLSCCSDHSPAKGRERIRVETFGKWTQCQFFPPMMFDMVVIRRSLPKPNSYMLRP